MGISNRSRNCWRNCAIDRASGTATTGRMPYTIGDRKLITHKEKEIYMEDFAAFDKSKTGALSREECIAVAKTQLGDKANELKVEKFIDDMDKNHDGKIEFQEYMEKLLGPVWEEIGGSNHDGTGPQIAHVKWHTTLQRRIDEEMAKER